jgi:hypothetical protein
MAQITIEVPDSLAEQLAAVKDRLPEVLTRGLQHTPLLSSDVYRYVVDFLASNPSPEAIVNFRPTPEIQARISELLEKNREAQLTPAEAAELEEYERINRFVRKFKIQALSMQRAES